MSGGEGSLFTERWTVDEIGDRVVRVLVARSRRPDIVAPVAAESRAVTEPEMARQAVAEVMAIELGRGPERDGADQVDVEPAWTEELDSVLDEAAVRTFIGRFRERSAVERPLRETDVFWVVSENAPARTLSDGRVRRAETEAVLAAYAAVNPVVRDMTSAARQASKILYHRAFRKSEEQS